MMLSLRAFLFSSTVMTKAASAYETTIRRVPVLTPNIRAKLEEAQRMIDQMERG